MEAILNFSKCTRVTKCLEVEGLSFQTPSKHFLCTPNPGSPKICFKSAGLFGTPQQVTPTRLFNIGQISKSCEILCPFFMFLLPASNAIIRTTLYLLCLLLVYRRFWLPWQPVLIQISMQPALPDIRNVFRPGYLVLEMLLFERVNDDDGRQMTEDGGWLYYTRQKRNAYNLQSYNQLQYCR